VLGHKESIRAVWERSIEQILEENHSPVAKLKKATQLLKAIQVNHSSILYTSERAKKNLLPRILASSLLYFDAILC
jgi:hypothetical protein